MALLAASCALWIFAILGQLGVAPIAGLLELDLYTLYAVAGAIGWVAGNVYVLRRRFFVPGKSFRHRLLLAYFLGPPSVVYLARALAPREVQATAPFVPWYALAVFAIFFLVPVTLKSSAPLDRRG